MIKRDWKFYLGIALLSYGVMVYLVIALLPFMKLSTVTAASIAAGLLISDEIAFLIAVVLLGKQFIELIKSKIRKWFAPRAAHLPPRPISKRRHYCGVFMLLLSFLPYWGAEVALTLGLVRENNLKTVIALLLSSDALFVIGLFVLGGEFWDRLKRLFEWRGEAAKSW